MHSQDAETYPGTNGHTRNKERLVIGNRRYDRHRADPMSPFSHGLGYTSFDISELVASAPGVDVKVTSAGGREGSTVLQVNTGDRDCSVERPVRELKGFAKVTLQPG